MRACLCALSHWGCHHPHHTCRRHCCCPQQGACCCHHSPLTSFHGSAAYPIPPSSRSRVFGWLLSEKILNGGHLRPSLYFIFVFSLFNLPPRNQKNTPPYTPPWLCILFIISPIAASDYRLIVVSYNQTAAT